MSYVIDVYRGQQQAIAQARRLRAVHCFFPQLVAGPIVRAREFFADLYNWVAPSSLENPAAACSPCSVRHDQKDRHSPISSPWWRTATSAMSHAHPGMLRPGPGPSLSRCRSSSISPDTRISRSACALLLGFHFPANFRRPYLAASITEFWRRWHMSLSAWLRDYLYIPLGGNRHGRLAPTGI